MKELKENWMDRFFNNWKKGKLGKNPRELDYFITRIFILEEITQAKKEERELTEKTFGGCKDCYGKGYHTTIEFTQGYEDFGGERTSREQLPIMRFCECDRGKQLKNLIQTIQ